MVQEKVGEFSSIITRKLVEVYKEVRADERTREIIVPKVGGKWSGKEGAERLRALIDAAKAKAGIPV
mgnify:CR=1 FL=1